jgi:hypothetical protein
MAFPQRFTYPENPEKAITVQHQNEAYLLLDTIDKFPIQQDGTYIFNFDERLQSDFLINHQKINGFGELCKVAVTEFVFPWVTPTVTPRNNTFYLQLSTGDIVYTYITEGWYTPVELATALQTALNTTLYTDYPSNTPDTVHATGWTVTSSLKTGQFLISNVNFAFITAQPRNAKNSLLSTMGFTSSITNYRNLLAGGIPPMIYTSYVDICSNALTKFQTLKDSLTQFNYTNIICRIYLQPDGSGSPMAYYGESPYYFGSRPSVIYRQIKDPKYMKWNIDQMISGIDIQYRDDSGNILYIPPISAIVPANCPKFTLKLVEDN